MSSLDIKDLYSTINEKTIKRLEIYDNVLVKCHKRIKYNSSLERTYCFYQIPEFIIGVPLYKVTEMRTYIINSLKNNGFKIMYIEPNWVFISWELPGISKLANTGLKKEVKIKENRNKYKSVDNYKPTGSLIYDERTMLDLSDKLKI
tara:strand:- start:1033 stop:1473 length:441 start_codon:yes stop_codon:yes gene_type:complete